MEIFHEFLFDAAHHFPSMPDGHQYAGVHGHSFQVEVTLSGAVDPRSGFLSDFSALESACALVREQLDHRYLNEIEGLRLPSLENISIWIWNRLKPSFPNLAKVVVRRESRRQGCAYTGP
jgi:6-pyruvoyltetrahydropterin/6-carboxytetrahydropterin synthase